MPIQVPRRMELNSPNVNPPTPKGRTVLSQA